MGFEVKATPEGRFEWTVWSSAYGLVMGEADTLDEARVEMLIAESDLYEHPYPEAVREVMRSDFPRFAAELGHVEVAGTETP